MVKGLRCLTYYSLMILWSSVGLLGSDDVLKLDFNVV